MRLFIETAGTAELTEIFEFRGKEIQDLHLQKVALAILKLDMPAGEGFEYVAIIDTAGATMVRFLQNRKSYDPWNQGREQKIGKHIGLFACFFQGSKIDPEEIPEYVRWHTLQNWIRFNEDSIREISLLVPR